jgi:peptide/nickel transport system permease protein
MIFVLKRLAIAIPMILLASFLMYTLVSLSGDPLARFLNVDPPPSKETLDAIRVQLGLDRPFIERYWLWLTSAVKGDFGETVTGIDVGGLLASRIQTTFRLIVGAMILAVVIAFVIGIVSSMRQFGIVDNLLSAVIYMALAMPVFWIAILLKNWAVQFNNSVGTTVFYTIGSGTGRDDAGSLFGYLALPVLALSINLWAEWSRYMRASMIRVLGSDYIRLARAKGLSRTQTIFRHGLRNALMPFVTVSALSFSGLVGGSIVTETVFQWRGMGDLILGGIRNYEINVIMGWLLIFAVATVVMNLVADVIYAVLDPRVRNG